MVFPRVLLLNNFSGILIKVQCLPNVRKSYYYFINMVTPPQ